MDHPHLTSPKSKTPESDFQPTADPRLEQLASDKKLQDILVGNKSSQLSFEDIEEIRKISATRIDALQSDPAILEGIYGKDIYKIIRNTFQTPEKILESKTPEEKEKIKNLQNRFREDALHYKMTKPDISKLKVDKNDQKNIDANKYHTAQLVARTFEPSQVLQNALMEMVMRELIQYMAQKHYPGATVLKTTMTDDVKAGIDFMLVLPQKGGKKEIVLADLAISVLTGKEQQKRDKLQNEKIPYDIFGDLAIKSGKTTLEKYTFKKTPIIIHPSIAYGIYSTCLKEIEERGEIPQPVNKYFDSILAEGGIAKQLINELHKSTPENSKIKNVNDVVQHTQKELFRCLQTAA